ncbi:MAG: Hsp20/alpha crystallin family protein [Bryobacteraceae bacterium]|nr:Hsp20/alpha crystallin family protein [Bryobacteraceae bacterium]MDW8378739.1 Hsp20/alpha crystallin family protein [Bryobacterales bacterium]
MALTRYNPFSALETLPSEFRLLQDSLGRLLEDFHRESRPWSPAVDILETDNELILKADVPDMDMKDIQVEIENGTLALKGSRKFESENKKYGYHRIERSYGSFARYFSLPDTVDPDKVAAEYHNGVLTITLPKKEVAKPRTVKVELKN